MRPWNHKRTTVAAARLPRRLALVALVALASVSLGGAGTVQASEGIDPSTLVPPPSSLYSCRALPDGETRCDFNLVIENDPFPTGLICGSGANAFEVWDGGESIRTVATRWYDTQGRIVRRTVHETFLGASFTNPQSTASVRYTQSNTILDTYAVAGDVTSAIESTVGNAAIFLVPGAGAIVLNAGKTTWVWDPDIDDLALVSSSGPQAFVEAFVSGNLSVLQPICDALAG